MDAETIYRMNMIMRIFLMIMAIVAMCYMPTKAQVEEQCKDEGEREGGVHGMYEGKVFEAGEEKF